MVRLQSLWLSYHSFMQWTKDTTSLGLFLLKPNFFSNLVILAGQTLDVSSVKPELLPRGRTPSVTSQLLAHTLEQAPLFLGTWRLLYT